MAVLLLAETLNSAFNMSWIYTVLVNHFGMTDPNPFRLGLTCAQVIWLPSPKLTGVSRQAGVTLMGLTSDLRPTVFSSGNVFRTTEDWRLTVSRYVCRTGNGGACVFPVRVEQFVQGNDGRVSSQLWSNSSSPGGCMSSRRTGG